MTNTVVSVTQVRDDISEILGRIKYGSEAVTVEKKGKPYAVMISPQQYEDMQKAAKDRFFNLMTRVQSRNVKYKENEVLKDITKAVDEVREEIYEREK